jgi:hypothetical protein
MIEASYGRMGTIPTSSGQDCDASAPGALTFLGVDGETLQPILQGQIVGRFRALHLKTVPFGVKLDRLSGPA